ncbi:MULTISPECIES: lytic transglycosylase domain-containing protein [unclassified Nocardia]|uniref:lytic transglycosylase domain-containing protein n=1 Tax=unclassified Nocardia TaxID=2637762 RepID=UPI002106F088|nr:MULTISPECIES: lytic murein transglycosylase [unclassified Nocardia]
MRISGPITASALVMAGLLAAASAPRSDRPAPDSIAAQLAAVTAQVAQTSPTTDQSIGLLPATPDPPRQLRAITPPANGALTSGAVPLHDISLPRGGTLGIPEIVLAAYRNAELALQSSLPGCGLTWYLLAGIGKIESDHANNGRTDADGTTIGIIYGPALDGTLPGNEVIKATDGGYVRAVGPMQFLPATWFQYASDGNGDGRADPNNVFDAALGAGKYLCSGGSDLRDPQQELQAILRYNNSLDYATQVLSWANAYRTGGVPQRMPISPNPTRPDPRSGRSMLTGAGSSMGTPKAATPTTAVPPTSSTSPTSPSTSRTSPPSYPPSPPTATSTQPLQIQIMIIIPGLPPIPCGIFCVLEPDPADPSTIPLPTTSNPGDCQGLWIPTCPPSTPPSPSTYQTPTVTVQPTSPWYPPTPTTPWYTPTTSPGPVPTSTTQPTPSQPTNPPPTPSETPTTTAQPTPPQPTTPGSAPNQPSNQPPTTSPSQPPLETSTATTQSEPTAPTTTPGQPSNQPPAAPPPNQPPPGAPSAAPQPTPTEATAPAPSQPAPPVAPPASVSPDDGQSATPAPAPPPTAPVQPTPIQPTSQPPLPPTDPVPSRVPTAATEPAPPGQPASLPPNQPAPSQPGAQQSESTPIAPGRTAEPKAPATDSNSSAPSQQPIAPAPPTPEPRPSRIPSTTSKPVPAAPAEPTRTTVPIPPPDEPEP